MRSNNPCNSTAISTLIKLYWSVMYYHSEEHFLSVVHSGCAVSPVHMHAIFGLVWSVSSWHHQFVQVNFCLCFNSWLTFQKYVYFYISLVILWTISWWNKTVSLRTFDMSFNNQVLSIWWNCYMCCLHRFWYSQDIWIVCLLIFKNKS